MSNGPGGADAAVVKNPNANPTLEKVAAYEAAVALLQNEGDENARYAALELRRCLEAVVYEKLKIYGALLPQASIQGWQPPKAFDALIAIEPRAQETATFAISLQAQPNLETPSPGPFYDHRTGRAA